MAECVEPCLDWPCPDLSCVCVPAGVQPGQMVAALKAANSLLHDQTNRRFPGCGCVAVLQPCVVCRCGCNCNPCKVDRIDLCGELGHPVHEILAITVNGEDQPLDGWCIHDRRYLVRPAKKGWPQQSLQHKPGEPCTWTVTVRYGTRPPEDLLKGRDQIFWQELAKCGKQSVNGCDTGVLIETTDKSGTHKRKEIDWYACAISKYGQRRRRGMYIDPAGECDFTGDIVAMVRHELDDTTPKPAPCCDPAVWADQWATNNVAPYQPGFDEHGLRKANC